jgi:large subunit ribosomal protein L24
MGATIRVNDTVAVIAGREKGKRGRVLRVLAGDERVIVEKVNFIKRHTKPSQKNRQGGIVEREAPLHRSNVQLLCRKCGKPSRVRTLVGAGGDKSRACARCGEVL